MSVLHKTLHQHRLAPSIWQFWLYCVLLTASCLFSVPVASAQSRIELEVEPRDIRSLNLTEKRALAVTIRKKLQHVVDKMKPFPGQAPYTVVRVTFETESHNEVLVIDLGAENGSFSQSADMSELGGALIEPVTEFLDEASISYPDFDFEFGGRDASYYDPQKRRDSISTRHESYDPQAVIPPEDARIVISAMHGYYLDMVEKTWKLQRPTRSNEIYEDFMTQKFVDPLITWIFTRYGGTVRLARSSSPSTPPGGSYPWWKLAGRYYLERLLPHNQEIWHSLDRPLPGRRSLWHYDEDIRSRPLYANHVGADVLINLHTNASTNTAANGTRAYVARNRPYDLELANSILCGMKEMIHAQEAYENFNVANQAVVAGNYGENNQARMSSVVLEVGFHTNSGDAAALKDPVFREAAMKGVEKGLRLKAEGKTCEPFKIASIQNVSGPHNTDIPAKIHYRGYPQFPVEQKTENVSCPGAWDCSSYNKMHTASELPLEFNFHCNASPTTPTAIFKWETTLTDADGLVTNVTQHSSTCTSTGIGSRAASSNSEKPTVYVTE